MIAGIFWICVLLILYTYALYPALLWLFARIFPAQIATPAQDSQFLPTVTLLISAYNEEAVIARKLENSLTLDYPQEKLQILVAVDGQEDNTKAIVDSYASRGVELSFSPQRTGKINAIHRAILAARADIIVLTDANTYFEQPALRRLVAPLADPSVGAVSGAKVIASQGDSLAHSEGLYWKYESFIKKQESRLGSCTGVCGEIFALRKDLFEPPPPRVINDDFYIAMQILRKGYRVVYTPNALTVEKMSLSANDEGVRRARIVAGRYQALWMGTRILPLKQPGLIWQVVSHKFLRPLVPFAMLGALLANLIAVISPVNTAATPLLRLTGPIAWICLLLQAAFYCLALWGILKPQSDHGTTVVEKILYLPAFFVNSNLAAVSGLVMYLAGRQTNLWQRVARRED